MKIQIHKKSLTALVVIAITSFLFLLMTMPRDLNIVDEGIILTDSIRVIHGEVFHRDFMSNYGPGQYYAVAVLFKLFSEDFLVARIYDLIVRTSILVTLFYIIRSYTSLYLTLFFVGCAAIWLLAIANYLYPIFPCMLLSLVASYLVARFGARASASPTMLAAGACAGFTALFRYEVGFFLTVANLFSLAVLIFLSPPAGTRPRRVLTTFAFYVAGIAIVFVPVATAFLLVSPVQPFYADIIDYNTKYYWRMRALPFPQLLSLENIRRGESVVYLPFVAVALALPDAVRFAARSLQSVVSWTSDDPSVAGLIVFGSTAAMLLLKGIVRVSPVHMFLGILPALVVLALLTDLWGRRGYSMRIAAILILLVVAVPTINVARRSIHELRNDNASFAQWIALKAGVLRETPDSCDAGPASGIAKLSPDYAKVANYIAAHTGKDERILVALDRHDHVYVNPVGLYFASGRQPGTHWHQFDPGLVSRADIQAKMIEDIQSNKVRLIVRDASFDDIVEPNDSAKSSGVTLLDDYIDANFRQVASSGKVAVWLANADAATVKPPEGPCQPLPAAASAKNP